MDSWTVAGNLRALIDAAAGDEHFVTRTRLQKIGYLLQEVLGVGLGADFRLSYYGPYSQDVASAADLLKQYGAIQEDESEDGFQIRPGEPCELFERSAGLEESELRSAVESVLYNDTPDLMLMATAHFIEASRGETVMDESELAEEVAELKPQFSRDRIVNAIRKLRELQGQAGEGPHG